MLGRSRNWIAIVCLWLGCQGLAAIGFAQGLGVSTQVSPNQVRVGDEARYTISVRGGSITGFPDSILVPGLTITYVEQSWRSSIVKGKSERRRVLHYSVKVEKEGLFVIPPQRFVVDGKEMSSKDVRIFVKAPVAVASSQTNTQPTVAIEVGKTEVYLGEVMPIALVVSVPIGARFQATDHPKMNPEGFALKRFGTAVLARAPDGLTFQYRYNSSISGIRVGKFPIGPAQLAFNLIVPTQRVPRQPLRGRTTPRAFRIKAEPVTVVVKPLPSDGKPEHFAGAVGQFTMLASASPTELKLHDPLVIDVKITGRGNFDQLTIPVLENPFGWQLYEARQYIENRSNGLQGGTVAFSQVARPHELLTELAPLVFSYFDPEKVKYLTLKSEPIPLTMEPDERAGLTTVEGKDFSMPAASVPREELGDVLTIFERPGRLRKADGSSESPSVLAWTLAFGYAIGALGIVAFGLRRSAAERRRQQNQTAALVEKRTAAEVLAELEGGGLAAKDFYAAALEYCGFFGEGNGSASERVREIVEKAEFLKFGATQGKSAEAVNASERKRVVDALRTLGRSES